MYEVSVKVGFKASHQLKDYDGKCENLHGHNWEVEVVAGRPDLDASGMVVDFHLLKQKLDEILKPFDHTRINFVTPFDAANPTAENLARYIYERLSESEGIRKACRVLRVTVSEDESAKASYSL